jgi:hypothetical protein
MLYKIKVINGKKTPVKWKGERINGVAHPSNVETAWSTEELAAIGLYVPIQADVPPLSDLGVKLISTSLEIVGGVPKYVDIFEKTTISDIRNVTACTKLQGKAVLYEYGLLDAVEALVAQADFITQLSWKEASTFKRNSPVLLALQTHLAWPNGDKITDEDLDALFTRAAELDF